MSRAKASFKCWSILITNLGKQSSFSPSVSFFFFFLCVCAVALVISLFMIYIYIYIYIFNYVKLANIQHSWLSHCLCI